MMCAHRPSPSPQTQEPSTVCITPASSASAATRSVSETLAGDVMSIPMDSDVLVKLRHASASLRNFSANVMRKVFSKAEREVSNVRGKLGKSQLDPEKIEYIKTVTFRMFPLDSKESSQAAWATCINAIDEANRRLYRKKWLLLWLFILYLLTSTTYYFAMTFYLLVLYM